MYGRDYSEWRECEDALAAVRAAMPSDPQVRDYVIKALAGGRKTSACEEMSQHEKFSSEYFNRAMSSLSEESGVWSSFVGRW